MCMYTHAHAHALQVGSTCGVLALNTPFAIARTLRRVADMALRQNIGRLLAAMVASTCSDTCRYRCNSWIDAEMDNRTESA